ncbi:MAG: hypothetical protein ACRDJW_09970 [Thermomicrobiales bacterium]
MPDLPDFLRTDDRQLWLLIGLCLVTIYTIQAVEEAVEGAWPHQRRPSTMLPRARTVHSMWGLVALLVLPGMLLAIMNVGMIVWKDVTRPETLALGGLFLGIGWGIFLLGSIDRLRLRRFVGNVGLPGAIALTLVLLIGDILLLIAFLDVRPTFETIRDALPFVD